MKNTCFYCNQKFYPSRSDQMYCSPSCRYKANRKGILILPLKKQWFDMILNGIKKEEYRERKPYWEKRFKRYFSYSYGPLKEPEGIGEKSEFGWHFPSYIKKEIVFRNGYGEDKPSFTALCSIKESIGKEEWGAEKDVIYYTLVIHSISNIKNVSK